MRDELEISIEKSERGRAKNILRRTSSVLP